MNAADAPEVTVEGGAAGPTITARWWHPAHRWWYPSLLVPLALWLGVALGVRYALVVARSGGLLIPVAMFLVLPGFWITKQMVTELVNTTTFRVVDGDLVATSGPLSRTERRVEVADVQQLRIEVTRRRAALVAVTGAGERVLSGQLTPDATVAVAQHLAQATGVVVAPPPPVPARPVVRALVSLTLLSAFCVWAVLSLSGPAIKGLVVSASLLDGPVTAETRLAEATRTEVWIRASMTYEEAVNPSFFFLDGLPPAFAIRMSGTSGTVDCDPFQVAFFVDQSVTAGARTDVSWYGRLADCAIAFPQGNSEIRLELVTRDGAGAFGFSRLDVLLRT